MKLIFPILLLLFFHVTSLAQEPRKNSPFDFRMPGIRNRNIDFPTDTSGQPSWCKRHDSILNRQLVLEKDFDFRFQLKQYYLQSNFDNVFVLTLKNNKWKAQYFTTTVKLAADNMNPKIEFVEQPDIEQSGVDQLWELLVQNNILTLPNQNSFRKKMKAYVIDTTNFSISESYTDVVDGVLYEFDLLTPKKQRHYAYANPNEHFKNYPFVKELADAILNIALIRKFLKQPIYAF
ncbi:MAG: hypothetical protein QM594_18700 [Niabella sp.]